MAPPGRTFTLLLVGLTPIFLGGCITLQGNATPASVPAVKPSEFAVLPPGARVSVDSTAKAVDTVATTTTQATSQRPTPAPAPEPSPAPAPEPSPASELRTVKAESPLPPLPALPGTAPAPEPPLLAAMRAYVQNHPEEALRHLQKLDHPSQEFALAVLPALTRVAQLRLDGADPNEVALLCEQVHAAAARLEPRAALRVDRITFCRRVEGFGRFDPRPKGETYRPNGLAELYVEIRNLTSRPSGDGYVTALASTLEIRDANGRTVEQTDPANHHLRVPVARFERTDFSRTSPRDYFVVFRFPVPAAPGVYTVTVEVRDPAGRVVRSKPAEFCVAGP